MFPPEYVDEYSVCVAKIASRYGIPLRWAAEKSCMCGQCHVILGTNVLKCLICHNESGSSDDGIIKWHDTPQQAMW